MNDTNIALEMGVTIDGTFVAVQTVNGGERINFGTVPTQYQSRSECQQRNSTEPSSNTVREWIHQMRGDHRVEQRKEGNKGSTIRALTVTILNGI